MDEPEDILGVLVSFEDELAGQPVGDADNAGSVIGVVEGIPESEGDIDLLAVQRCPVDAGQTVDQLLGRPGELD